MFFAHVNKVRNANYHDTYHTFGLLFNEAKCKAQHITRKTNPILSSYKLNKIALESYAAENDLGVWISKDLTWYKQVNEQSSRANKLLNWILKEEHEVHA